MSASRTERSSVRCGSFIRPCPCQWAAVTTPEPIALAVPCDRCGADEGQRCVGLARPDDVHATRLARAQAARRESYGPPDSQAKANVRRIIQTIRERHGWA